MAGVVLLVEGDRAGVTMEGIEFAMKAVVYYRYDDIRIEEVAQPRIGRGELLVRVAGCGLCGSDLLKMQQRAVPPVALGHELAGVVVEVGAGVSQFCVGQRVVVAHHAPCGECHYCRHGNVSMCPAFKASNIDPCGLAEYIRVPAANVARVTLAVPDHLSNEEAAFTEPLGCVVRAVRRSHLLPGDTAVVFGLGTMGLLLLQTIGAFGARAVGVDLIPERLALAERYGGMAIAAGTADLAARVRDLTAGRGADVVLLTAGGASVFAQAVDLLRPGGMVNIFASAPGTLATLDLDAIYHRELVVQATYSSSPEDLRTALDLLATGKVRVDGLVTHRLPLDRFHEGVELFRTHRALKVYFMIADSA
jgi:L-iditol 2-dehydrogenase